jgi:hypothetical protein
MDAAALALAMLLAAQGAVGPVTTATTAQVSAGPR